MTDSNIKDHPVFIITGKRGEGKTTFLLDLIERLKDNNLTPDGFLAIASTVGEPPDCYTLSLIKTGESIPLCFRDPVDGWMQAGPFHFNPEALEAGNHILTHPAIVNNDLIIVDEIGKLELDGKIWATSLSRLLRNASCPLILSIRETFVDQVIERWELQVADIFNIRKSTSLKVSQTILKRIKSNKQ